MGILSNLFKAKSAKSESERPEMRPSLAMTAYSNRIPDECPAAGEEAGAPASTPKTDEEFPGKLSLGGFKRNAAEKAAAVQEPQKHTAHGARTRDPEAKSHTRSFVPVKAAAISEKQIAIEMDDVLPKIPQQFLKEDRVAGARKQLLFNTYELLPSLAQGKGATPLARIAELAPELFNGEPLPADVLVELPLQKIIAQIGIFPGRPDQVEEIYPPLDARYAKLAVEKGVVVEPAQPPPAVEAVTAVEEGSTPQIPDAEAGANGSDSNHLEAPPAGETVSYSLAAIFPHVPESWLDGNLKSVDRSARIAVPFGLVEAQLASGRVEIPFEDFFKALPENLKGHFPGGGNAAGAAKVLVPMPEVILNLPGVEPLPPSPEPVHPEPEAEVAVEEPAAPEEIQEEKSAPVLSDILETLVEEQISAEAEAALETENLQAASEPVAEDPETVLLAAAEPVAETEPATETESVAAVEPPPAEMPAPEPPPKPAMAQIAPPSIENHEEQPKADAAFITPRIQVQRMTAPPLSKENRPPARETPDEQPVAETSAPDETGASMEAAAPLEPAPALHPALKDLIATDGKLDARKALEHLVLLPGVKGAAITIKGKTKTAGDIPEFFHAQDMAKAASALFQSLEGHAAKGAARSLTLHHDQFSSTWFKQDGVLLCILHPQRSLEAEPHQAVLLVMREIARLRQH